MLIGAAPYPFGKKEEFFHVFSLFFMFPSQIICVRRVPLIVKSCVRSPKQIREYQNIVFQTIDPRCHCFTRQSVLWPLNEWWSFLPSHAKVDMEVFRLLWLL